MAGDALCIECIQELDVVVEVIEPYIEVVEVIDDAEAVVDVLETGVDVIEVETGVGLPGPPGPPGATGGIKVYPDLATAQAVRVTEVGILHVENVRAAFPDTSLDSKAWGGDGPGDFVFTTVVHDTPTQSGPVGSLTVAQTVVAYDVLNDTPYPAQRIFAYMPGDPESSEVFKAAPQIGPAMSNYVAIGQTNGSWGRILASNTAGSATVVKRLNGTAEFNDPVNPKDAVNKQTLEAAMGAVPLPPRLGEVAAFLTDWNTALTNGWWMGQDAANAPEPGIWLIGEVLAHLPAYLIQKVYTFTEAVPRVYTRQRQADVWGAWVRVYQTAADIAALPVPPHTHPEIGGTHRFLFDATPAGDPGTGRVSVENTGGQNRLLRVSKTDADGGEVNLAVLAINDSVALSATGATPAIYARGYAITVATDAGTHWEFTVTRESGVGVLPADATPLLLNVTLANGAGTSADVWLKWTGTQAEYDAIVTKDPNTLYVVVG